MALSDEIRDREFRKFAERAGKVTVNANEVDYAFRVEYDSNLNPIYEGWAAPGSLTSAAVWKIRKTTYDSNNLPTKTEWANGNADEDNIWDNRASLSYS